MTTRTYGYMTALTDGSGWVIRELESHVRLRLKQLFPRIPRTASPPYTLKGGEQMATDLMWFMQRYPLRIDDAVRRDLERRRELFERQQTELFAILSSDWRASTRPRFRDGCEPWQYQMQAVELARRAGRLLVVDELGLGKTITALAAIADERYLPALVVPPTHLTQQWAEKIAEFTPLTSHTFMKKTPYHLPKADIYICPYSKLDGWTDYAQRQHFKSVVFDEIHELRTGGGTGKGAAAKIFARNAELRIGLSGTPIYNYGDEMFNVADVLAPGILGSRDDFLREWTSDGRKVNDPAALGTFLREQHLMIRRTRSDVGQERKFPNVVVQQVPYDNDVLAADDALMRDLAWRVTHGSFTAAGQASREFDMRLRLATGVAKARHAAAFVRLLVDSGRPVVLCGWHRDVYEIWQRELAAYRPALYTGTESVVQKSRAKDAFISGETDVLIMSLRSGAGLDGLQTRCSTMVFGELDWSPKVHEQCGGRLDRPGQKNEVDLIYLHADGGSDPAVLGVLGVKASQSHGIVDPNSAPLQQQSDGARIKQLAELYLSGKLHLARPAALAHPPAPTREQADLFS